MFRFCQLVVKRTDNPDLFVTSAMMDQSNMLKRSAGSTIHLRSQESTRETPCSSFKNKCATSRMTPKYCKDKCGGTKVRLFF